MKPSELLSRPEAWCKGYSARNQMNDSVEPRSEQAVKWCMWGAMIRCNLSSPEHVDRLNMVVRRKHKDVRINLVDFNDYCAKDHAEVIAVLQEAGL